MSNKRLGGKAEWGKRVKDLTSNFSFGLYSLLFWFPSGFLFNCIKHPTVKKPGWHFLQ